MKKYFIYLLCIFISSCNSSQKNEFPKSDKELNEMSLKELLEIPVIFSKKEYVLEKVKEISIPIDSVSASWSAYPIYHDADTAQYYVQGNEAINSIDFYDLDKETLYKRVKFERTGNQMISSTRKFFIRNADSIYIFEDKHGKVNLVNIEGEILQRYDLPEEYDRFSINAGISAPFFVSADEKIYFRADVFIGISAASDITEDFVKTRKTIGVFDLRNRKLMFKEPTAPLHLASPNNAATTLLIGSFFEEDYTILNTSIMGHIQYLKNGQNKQAVLRRKDFDKENITEMRRESNGINYDDHFLIIPDERNSLFYSVILEGIEEEDLDGNPNSYDDKPITVVIADENFHHAGEYTLPKDTHFRNVMMTRDGLLVSNANPKNPNNDEGVLSFTLYKPKQIK